MKVRANQTCIVAVDGVHHVVKAGDAFDKNDPVVRQHRWLFDADNVEQASAAPGEKRNVRRG